MAQKTLAQIELSTVAARLGQTAALFIILGSVLFLGAGRLDWWEAWVFLAVYFAIAAATSLWLLYRDPALSEERSQVGKYVKPWDRLLVSMNLLLTLALWAVIGLDAGRFGWSAVPAGARWIAGLVLLASFSLTTWAAYANTFLSGRVRIQEERGHHVVSAGPYHYVRHPMYGSMILYDLSLPLLLGSAWALVVSALMIGAVLARTALEDKTLHVELPGYAEYARQTRFRLLPFVW